MTPDTLRAAGKLLYGHNWRTAFLDAFDLSARSLARMLAKTQPIPEGLALDVEQALRERANQIDVILDSLAA